MDTAEDDRVRVGSSCLAAQPKRVTDIVGDVLDLGQLIVVGQDDGATLPRQRADLILKRGNVFKQQRSSRRMVQGLFLAEHWKVHGSGSSRRERSRAVALWVSAPTDMKSTPVSATALIVSRVKPPLASSSARPSTSATASRSCSGFMLSSRIRKPLPVP